MRNRILSIVLLLFLGVLAYCFILPNIGKERTALKVLNIVGDPVKGEYLLRLAGCVACHTDIDEDGEFLAGGPAIETDFGRFFAPNITADKQHGIGAWSLSDLYYALTAGLSPKDEHYYPAFPYTSYHTLELQEISDLKAYLDTVQPSQNPRKPHELIWPFSDRNFLGLWKWFNFEANASSKQIQALENVDRGQLIVEGAGHCGECHTPRNLLGAMKSNHRLAGNDNGPEGHSVPGLKGPQSKIKQWELVDLILYLQTGIDPDGDAAGGAMSEVIYESTSYLNDEDIEAIASYILKR